MRPANGPPWLNERDLLVKTLSRHRVTKTKQAVRLNPETVTTSSSNTFKRLWENLAQILSVRVLSQPSSRHQHTCICYITTVNCFKVQQLPVQSDSKHNVAMIKPGGGQSSQTGSMTMVLPSTMSGALPCFITPPVQNDLVVKDTADRGSRNLKTTKKQKQNRSWPEGQGVQLHSHAFSPHLIITIQKASDLSLTPPCCSTENSWANKQTDRQTQSHCCFTWNVSSFVYKSSAPTRSIINTGGK